MFKKAIFLATMISCLGLAPSARAGNIIAWVAPYSVAASQTMLTKDFGGVGMKDGISFLALQFWITNGPSLNKDGNISASSFDQTVNWFVNWGHQYGIAVELCIDNYVNGWSWPEAVRAFGTNRGAFVKSIVAEVKRLNLDGVDLDFEGTITLSAADRDAYYAFAAELSDSMHATKRIVTVASFAAQWNAPNWDMWPTLFQKVDGITSMGYDQSGLATDYSAQRQHAASAPEKFMIGMPGYKGSWLGNSVTEQIDWVVADGKVGLGIWDATLSATEWQTATVWNKLKSIRQKPVGITAAPRTQSIASAGGLEIEKCSFSGVDVKVNGIAKCAARAAIFDTKGRKIAAANGLANENGSLSFRWNRARPANGFYTVVVRVNGMNVTRRILVTD